MIGAAIRKFAQERGLTCDAGYAYGALGGRHVFLDEGYGYKRLCVYLYPPAQGSAESEALCARVERALSDCDLKAYRLHLKGAVRVEAGFAHLTFRDMAGTMKRIERYIDEVLPRLDGMCPDAGRCACCGEELGDGAHYVVLDDRVLPVHDNCVRKLSDSVDSAESEPRSGSLLMGALGALVGAVIGAIPWALMYVAGYISGVIGFVIGALANFFYGKFGGKRSGARIAIVLLALVFGIALGQAGGCTLEFAQIYDDAGVAGTDMSRGEFVRIFWEQYLLYDQETALGLRYDRVLAELAPEERTDVMTREEYVETYYNAQVDELRDEMREGVVRDCGMGLIFGLMGCVGVFLRVYKENKRRRVKELN